MSAVEILLPSDFWTCHSDAASQFPFSSSAAELPWLCCGCADSQVGLLTVICKQALYTPVAASVHEASHVCAAAACWCNVTQAAVQLDHLAVAATLSLHCWSYL